MSSAAKKEAMVSTSEEYSHQPLWSPEEAAAIAETQEAFRDIYGTGGVDSFEAGEEVLQKAKKELLFSIAQKKPEEREAYDEAMEKCPHLVEMESNPVKYLKAHKLDFWEVASKICLYWKFRKEIFGDRAFRPMSLTGLGVMSANVVRALKCCGTVVMPPDNHGRYLFMCDKYRLCQGCGDSNIRLQHIFYIMQMLSDDPMAQKNGVVGMIIFDSQRASSAASSGGPHTNILRFFQAEIIPVKLVAFHFVVMRSPGIFERTIPVWIHLFRRYKFLSLRTVTHYSASKEMALQDLKQYGFKEDCLPKCVGGGLDIELHFKKWYHERLTMDVRRHPPSFECEDDTLEDLTAVAESARAAETRDRKRKVDAVYQKRKRETERKKLHDLKNEVSQAETLNRKLKTENERLLALLNRAAKIAIAEDSNRKPPAVQQNSIGLAQYLQQRTGDSSSLAPTLAGILMENPGGTPSNSYDNQMLRNSQASQLTKIAGAMQASPIVATALGQLSSSNNQLGVTQSAIQIPTHTFPRSSATTFAAPGHVLNAPQNPSLYVAPSPSETFPQQATLPAYNAARALAMASNEGHGYVQRSPHAVPKPGTPSDTQVSQNLLSCSQRSSNQQIHRTPEASSYPPVSGAAMLDPNSQRLLEAISKCFQGSGQR